MTTWTDPRVFVTAALLGLFAFAFAHNPADEAMKGALITGFAAAYGYWIGASKGGTTAQENIGKALDLANSTTTDPQPVVVTNDTDQPVPVEAKP